MRFFETASQKLVVATATSLAAIGVMVLGRMSPAPTPAPAESCMTAPIEQRFSAPPPAPVPTPMRPLSAPST